MALLAKGGNDDSKMERKLIPVGTHVGLCDLIADLGMQEGFEGADAKHEIYLRFQLPNEQMEWEKDGVTKTGPMVIGDFLRLSMWPRSKLRIWIESWLNRELTKEEAEKGFDVFNLLSLPAQLVVIHKKGQKGETRDKILMVLPYGGAVKYEIVGENLPLMFDPDNQDNFDLLPEWIRKKIDKQILPI